MGIWAILISLSQDFANLLQPVEWLLDHPYIDILFVTLVILGLILGTTLGYKRYLIKGGGREKL